MSGTFGSTNADGKFIPSKSYTQMLDEKDREIKRLREVVEAAERWRRAFHHGTRDEIELQESCLLDAISAYQQYGGEK